jgi:uncharacterized protein involved in exopolysaccharide biosynthesis
MEQEAHGSKHPTDIDGEIDLKEIFNVLFQGKWIIISVTTFISIIGVVYSLSLPNIYTSKALLVPVDSSSSFSGKLGGGYTGLAGLPGINLTSGSNSSNSIKALEKITSLSLFENNILTNIFLPDLMAIKSWNSQTNTIIYDESIYKVDTNTWIDGFYPSAQKSFREFENHLDVNLNRESGFITLTIKHQSPFIAKQWSELIINEVNAFYRQKDRSESERAVNYLNQQISITSLSEIKQVLAQLLQEQIKKLTLIEANESYVFDYIDPPAVMEKKSEPRRAYICIVIAIFGGMMSVFLVFIRHYFLKEKVS